MFGNWLKTSILMAGIVALFGVVGAALGGAGSMLLAFAIADAISSIAHFGICSQGATAMADAVSLRQWRC